MGPATSEAARAYSDVTVDGVPMCATVTFAKSLCPPSNVVFVSDVSKCTTALMFAFATAAIVVLSTVATLPAPDSRYAKYVAPAYGDNVNGSRGASAAAVSTMLTRFVGVAAHPGGTTPPANAVAVHTCDAHVVT